MSGTQASVVDVQVACDDPDIPDEREIESWVHAALNSAVREPGDFELAVRIVSSVEMQDLNAEYGGKDRPTNVLSFPTGSDAGLPPDAPRILGDIVICANVVMNEAEAQGKHPADHWAHMLVHGTLHLLGYDHESDEQARVMEALETQVLCNHGLADPYSMRQVEPNE